MILFVRGEKDDASLTRSMVSDGLGKRNVFKEIITSFFTPRLSREVNYQISIF
jgi:hypothetical protein